MSTSIDGNNAMELTGFELGICRLLISVSTSTSQFSVIIAVNVAIYIKKKKVGDYKDLGSYGTLVFICFLIILVRCISFKKKKMVFFLSD